jgi:hypothetical protein
MATRLLRLPSWLLLSDKQAPAITCSQEITQTADPGMCSATVTVVPPVVTDNCDNNVLPVSSNELIKNGNFNDGVSNWQDCVNKAEVNTEEYYIVPLPPKSSNYVAEVDKEVSLCQIISGFTVGDKYVLTFKATRRQNTSTPNPVSANVVIDGGALSEVVTRTNTTFELTPESFVFTATQETHQLKFTPYTDNTYVLGFIVDDVSIKSITYPVGTTTLVWTATDVYGNTNTCKQKITVNDEEAPTAICKDIEVMLGQDGTVLIEENAVNNGSSDNCTSASNLEFDTDVTFFDCTKVGVNHVEMTVTDEYGNSSTCKAVVTVLPYNATTEVAVLPDPQQYSDKVTFTATVKPASVESGCVTATHVTFWVGNQQMGPAVTLTNGTVSIDYPLTELPSYPSNGQMAPGSHGVKAVFSGVDPAFIVPDAASILSITQEDAITTYTGQEFVGEQNPSASTTPLILSATVTDMDDSYRGDIRNSRVQFYDVNTLAPLSDWLTPGLVVPGDLTQGVVTQIWNAPVPTSGYNTFTIGVKVGTQNPEENGYYVGSDKAVVNVFRTELYEFITGGGHIIPTESKGAYASDPGRKVNFGFNVKWNKTMNRLQGNLNLIFRIGDKVYQIKANSMSSLSINSFNPCSQQAVFTSKANLSDVTLPGLPVELKGNLSLQVTMTNNTSPGATSTIGFAVYDGNTLLYSSNWPVNKTEELPLAGGNIIVHNGITCIVNNKVDVLLSTSLNPSFIGDEVIFEAVVAPKGSTLVPEGSIVFRDGSAVIGNVPLNNGKAILQTSDLTAGVHPVTAEYVSSNDFENGTSNLVIQQVVNAVLELVSNLNPSTVGETVTFIATVSASAAGEMPTGTVTFKVGTDILGAIPLTGGSASFGVDDLPAGVHVITAEYNGDANYDPLLATLTQTVNSNVSITLASSKNPEQVNTKVTFTATVAGSGSVLEGVEVSFYIKGKLEGTAVTNGDGNATWVYTFTSTGTYLVEASYAGQPASLSQVIKTKVKSAEIVAFADKLDLKVYPNPFSDRLFLEFVSPVNEKVRIEIFDITGRKVETVFNSTVEAGVTYKAVFIPNKIIDGIYLYRMSMGEDVFNGKVVFNRR